jgi:hypothetical protein
LLRTKERVLSQKFLPKISLSVSDRRGFEQLAFIAAVAHHQGARFMLEEIGRAEIIPDDADDLPAIVTMGSSVRYRLNWGSRAEIRMLAYPEGYASNRSHFSVRSPGRGVDRPQTRKRNAVFHNRRVDAHGRSRKREPILA